MQLLQILFLSHFSSKFQNLNFYQLLDGIIGEEDVETCIGIIEETDNKELTKFDKVDLINKVDNLKRKKEMENGKIFN